METELEINSAKPETPHRQSLDEVIGCQLASNQRLVICVKEISLPAKADSRPAQTLADWTQVYEGLSDAEVDAVDQIVNNRVNLTRHLP
ncbi:MAG: hypothetical protein JWM11_3888 [Planctomycetaceae bacterium]|nr:hypothetical protein [Planctomycetaceae bacterium]